jgi:hypothetical protein
MNYFLHGKRIAVTGIAIGEPQHIRRRRDTTLNGIGLSLKFTRSMSGMARRIAETLDPETKPVRKAASSISRAPIPSPQPGITCSRGSSRSVLRAAACGRIFVSPGCVDTVTVTGLPRYPEPERRKRRDGERSAAAWPPPDAGRRDRP